MPLQLRYSGLQLSWDAGGWGDGSSQMLWSCGITALGWTMVPLPEQWGSTPSTSRGDSDGDGGNLRKMPGGIVIKSVNRQ